ncbi:MAG: hypothetical protein IT431_02630 [Phycisphaerales bacterium]|nr:hypothetical protein [Phycisphaerales bacterium]
MLTLWDLLEPKPKARPAKPAPARTVPGTPVAPRPPGRAKAPPSTAAVNYLRMEREMLARYGVRVRKWRSNTSGVAWEVQYRDGTMTRLIESPRPRGPVSAAIFLHEIGHHAIGFDRYKVRCVEEYHAWRFALDQMAENGITITPRVRRRVADSLEYAIAKASRRGLRAVPPEVEACILEQRRLLAEGVPDAGGDSATPSRAHASAPKSASMNAPGSNG